MRRPARTGGVALVLFALQYLAGFVRNSPVMGLEDGDNAANGINFVLEHPDGFFASGVASMMAAFPLAVAVLSIAELDLRPATSLAARFASAFGLFGAAYAFACGLRRCRTVLHRASGGKRMRLACRRCALGPACLCSPGRAVVCGRLAFGDPKASPT